MTCADGDMPTTYSKFSISENICILNKCYADGDMPILNELK